MTCLDDITRGTSAFNYAIRHPHKSGAAFEIMRGRRPPAAAALPALIGAVLVLLAVGAIVGA